MEKSEEVLYSMSHSKPAPDWVQFISAVVEVILLTVTFVGAGHSSVVKVTTSLTPPGMLIGQMDCTRT